MAAHTVGGARADSGIGMDMLAQVRQAEGDVPRLILRGKACVGRGYRFGRPGLT